MKPEVATGGSWLLQQKPRNVILGKQWITAVAETVGAQGQIRESIEHFTSEIALEKPFLMPAVGQGDGRGIVVFGDQDELVAALIETVVHVRQFLRVHVDEHPADQGQIEGSDGLELKDRLGVDLQVGECPEMRDGAFVNLDRGKFNFWDQAAKSAKIEPAVGTEFNGGTQFAAMAEDFGEKMK